MDKHILLAIFHIFLVAPLFLMVGYMRANTPIWLYWTMLVLGILIFVYHAYRAFVRYSMRSSYLWVNLLHIFYVAPLLMYIGYYKKDSVQYSYELLLMVGFAALGYHLFSLVRSIQTIEIEH